MTPIAIINEALAAYEAAARDQWNRDGLQDCGSCGGYMLGYRANSKFAQELIARGIGHRMGTKVYLSRPMPEDIITQHMLVEVRAAEAFRAVASSYGVEPTEARSYVD